MSIREPNSEQKLAIEHNGGVLLSAGAGSGKTFVLIEHLIHLFKGFRDEVEGKPQWEIHLRERFSKIVVMTFTNKAASEIKIRLISRIEDEAKLVSSESSFDSSYWQEVKASINYLTLGTIHGFCLKVLNSGLLPEVKAELNLLSEYEIEKCIENGIDRYFDKREGEGESNFVEGENILPLLRLQRNIIKSSFVEIFNDAQLRSKWDESLLDDKSLRDESFVLKQCVLAQEFNFDLPINWEKSSKPAKWEEFIDHVINNLLPQYDLNTLTNTQEDSEDSFEICEKWNEYFSSLSRFPTISKKASQEIISLGKELKRFRDFLKEHFENFKLYREHKSYINKIWHQEMKAIYLFLAKEYSLLKGISFSDMEYLLAQGLKNHECLNRLNQSFKYFIIDEFQDTSKIQFQIIERIIKGDFSKLFCIGDLKQAIYGFRGGEISVFKYCSERINKNLSLSNNYRSLGEIIDFNNQFFDDVFATGDDFNSSADLPFDPSPQSRPLEYAEKGKVILSLLPREKLEAYFEKDKLATGVFQSLEAQVFANEIEHSLEVFNTQCVLYKKLAPSGMLLKEFLKRDIPFQFQVKISLGDDPIIFIFLVLITRFDFEVNSVKSTDREEVFLINETFEYLLGSNFIEMEELSKAVENFYINAKKIDLIDAYTLLLLGLGFSTTYIKESLSLLVELYKASGFDLEELLLMIKDKGDSNYSIDFQKGDNPQKVQVMTVHRSKGLEFDRVYLGGIWTNGRSMVRMSNMGKTPGAFKWKLDIQSKESFPTPELILENILDKKSDFQEDKRLLYVANTRAKKELFLLGFELSEKEFKINPKSWGKAFENFQIKKREFFEVEINDSSLKALESEKKRPFFNTDTTGFSSRLSPTGDIKLLGEMSVTGFSEIALCPRKFYLRNILKYGEEDLELLDLEKNNEVKVQTVSSDFSGKSSNAERGTEIHDQISRMVKRNFVIPFEVLNTPEENLFYWVKEKIKGLNPISLWSEEDVKFPVFGHMFNGKPDLVIQTKKGYEVWDFKTGRLKSNAPQYNLQLLMYAYSIYQRGFIGEDEEVKLVLMYVDEKEKVEWSVNYQEVIKELKFYWNKTNEVDQVERDHCSSCLFGKLCRFSDQISHQN